MEGKIRFLLALFGIIALAISLSSYPVYGQLAQISRQSTTITLQAYSSSVTLGSSIIFSGKLEDQSGTGVSYAIVSIKEENCNLNCILVSGTTDSGGSFALTWTSDKTGTLSIFANFDGNLRYQDSSSSDITVQINSQQTSSGSQIGNLVQNIQQLREHTLITLNPIPSSVHVGQEVTFSGKLNFEQSNPFGWMVYIEAKGSRTISNYINPDHLLATGWVLADGTYSVNWRAVKVTTDDTLYIYAKFEGGERFLSSSTCGPTCSGLMSTMILPPLPLPPPPPPPPQITNPPPIPMLAPDASYNGPYIKTYFPMPFDKTPLVAVVIDPNYWNKLHPLAQSVVEGIKYWTEELSSKYPNGNWNINVEVILQNEPYSQLEPDMVIELVAPETQQGCIDTWSGLAYPSQTKPVQAWVCGYVGTGENEQENPGIPFSAAHEFYHTLGMGHAFDYVGDLMCSSEGSPPQPTCGNDMYANDVKPSPFDLAALVDVYGFGGFVNNPNYQFASDSKFTYGDFAQMDPTDAIASESTTSQNPSSVSNNPYTNQNIPQTTTGTTLPLSLTNTIPVQNTPFSIGYSITNGYLGVPITIDAKSDSLPLNITPTSQGELTVEMPRALIDAKRSDGTDSQFVVLNDGQQNNQAYKIMTTNTDRTLDIPFKNGTQQIEIVGTFAIPEFGYTSFLVLSTSIVSLIVVSGIRNTKGICFSS